MVHCRIGTFGAYPEPLRQSGFTIDPYGQKIQIHITHDSHTSQKIIFFYKEVCINVQILAKLILTSVSCVNIVLFKGKVGANFKVLRCPRSFKCRFHQHGKAWISIPGFLNQANRISECNFTACQNSVSEHSFEGVPASLYNPTKSVPDPLMEMVPLRS